MTPLAFLALLAGLFALMLVISGRRRARMQRAAHRDEVMRRRRADERAAADSLRVGSNNVVALGNGRVPIEDPAA